MSLHPAETRGEFALAPRRRWRRRVALPAIATGIALAWLAGLVWFAQSIPSAIEDPDTPTDAIVVLTGGSLRLEHGLDLLVAGKAKKLFVSGVHQGVPLAELLRHSPNVPAWVHCCIVLGHRADSTLGNAVETAAWMRRENYHSLRLVTASYHMRRSLFEFGRALPDIRIIAHPVFPARVKLAEWWEWPGTAALIIGEYDKYLGAVLRAAVEGPIAAGAPQSEGAKAEGG
ncbi:MAG TPA: YdcF family protein [Stellaceae bacterium]|nr:YdcF family protein [Stellaceae bacterium]